MKNNDKLNSSLEGNGRNLPNFHTGLELGENMFMNDGNISAKYLTRLKQIKKVYGTKPEPVIGPNQMIKSIYTNGGSSIFKQSKQPQKHFIGNNKQVY